MELILISQDGCNPCTMVKNFLINENVDFNTINISKERDAIETFNVMSTPVLILMDENEEIARVMGFKPQEIEILISQM